MLRSRNRMLRTLMITVFSFGAVTAAPNLLLNPSFETVGSAGSSASLTGTGGAQSAADKWFMFNQFAGTTTTQLCPLDPSCPAGSPLPVDGSEILKVTTDHVENGVFQSFLPLGQGPAYVNASIWIYLVGPAGIPQQVRVGVGAGNNFNTVYDAYEVTPNQWVKLSWSNSLADSPVNEIIIYTTNLSPPTGTAAGGTFYLDAGSITAATPEPGTVFGAAGGLLGLAIAAIRRKRIA